MVAKLSTTIEKIQNLPNSSNRITLNEFLFYMKNNGSSERHQNSNLTVMVEFSNYSDSNCPRCEFFNNAIENKYDSKCSYPLKPEA
jgi:hypothetical protein